MSGSRKAELREDGQAELENLLRERFAIVLAGSGVTASGSEEADTDVRALAIRERDAFPYAAADLLEPSVFRDWLDRHARKLGGASPEVVGTMFAKRYSVLISGMFAAYTLYDIPLSTNLNDLRIRLEGGAAMAYLVRLDQRSIDEDRSEPEDRRAAFSSYADRIEKQLRTVLGAVSTATGAKPKVLHSLVLHQVHTLYEWLEAESSRLENVSVDREVLQRPEHAGFHASFRRIEGQPSDRPLLMRRYCCQAYRTSVDGRQHGYCESCPKAEAR